MLIINHDERLVHQTAAEMVILTPPTAVAHVFLNTELLGEVFHILNPHGFRDRSLVKSSPYSLGAHFARKNYLVIK
jgi:hypothetical protein